MADLIYEAKLEELSLVSNLAKEIWPQAFSGILNKEQIEDMLDKIYNLDALKKENQELGHVFWLAKRDAEHLGYASAYQEKGTLWLKKIYLKPEAQGHGFGTALIKTAIDHFPLCKKIALYVNKDNKAAQGFYEKQGFKKESEQEVQMGSFQFTDYIMSKNLYN